MSDFPGASGPRFEPDEKQRKYGGGLDPWPETRPSWVTHALTPDGAFIVSPDGRRLIRLPREERVSDDTRALRAELLLEQIRVERAKADIAEIELEITETKERERKAQPSNVRRYPFFGDMTPDTCAECINAISYWAERDPGEPITLLINTGGGEVQYGLALFDTIKRIQAAGTPVITHASGRAMSMGAVLLQAGTERVIDARATLMIHEGSVQLAGSAGQVEDATGYVKLLRNQLLDILSEQSTLTRKQVETRWKRKDWYLSAEEALEAGFVDRIA